MCSIPYKEEEEEGFQTKKPTYEYANTLVKAVSDSNKRINSREDFKVLISSQIFTTSYYQFNCT